MPTIDSRYSNITANIVLEMFKYLNYIPKIKMKKKRNVKKKQFEFFIEFSNHIINAHPPTYIFTVTHILPAEKNTQTHVLKIDSEQEKKSQKFFYYKLFVHELFIVSIVSKEIRAKFHGYLNEEKKEIIFVISSIFHYTLIYALRFFFSNICFLSK